jgi:hypothetical protein
MKTTAALLFALLLSLLALPSPAAETAKTVDPAQAVQSFFDFHFKHSMGFGMPEMKVRKAWLAPDLYALITTVLKKPVPKGDAPDIEGDIFTDSQDTPTSFRVGHASVKDQTARVEVTLQWSGEKRQLTVLLQQIERAWRIVDIEYGDHRTLTKDLRAAVH